MNEELRSHVVRRQAATTKTNTKELAERAPQRSRTDLRRLLASSACEAYQWRTSCFAEADYNVKLYGAKRPFAIYEK